MLKQEAKGKPKYESPAVVPLGEMAQGTGYCAPGSNAADSYCTAGTVAGTACTAGTGAPAACTHGSGTGTCTGGSLVGSGT
jgi:hypothetical protein